MRHLLDAVTFLTRVPLPVDHRRAPDLARAAVWFPTVGAVLGAGLLLVGSLLAELTPTLVAVVLVVVLEVLLTGALHLDGLADLADGTGGHDRESRLRIMKDHAVGVYGTAAVVLALLLEVALLVGLVGPVLPGMPWAGPTWLLPSSPGWLTVALTGAAAWSLSRAAMLPVALLLPYARTGGGTGRSVVEGLAARHTVLAWALPVLLCMLLGGVGLGMLVGAALGALLVGGLAHRLLGGATGDVLGATAQVALLGALLGAAVAL
ncbi:adenosylcobinamide-GDP ribazoletransferase [Ornithinimicrobium tianjinense]|uniref:Adenosylcobinamide-GDP ribazoletransferase n=1 Tax=Ornithinimicrobium tianjinense TaxID=1195761 RepID=A0A917BRV7_9MICO|nr:adenosylcobinamide-GDP ribazoletransferase [Ornithinimicrobium tianjinense]GGF52130.1 hypothetical protein GCM10011366_20000 [Ornithinimicrobium tianjinense]